MDGLGRFHYKPANIHSLRHAWLRVKQTALLRLVNLGNNELRAPFDTHEWVFLVNSRFDFHQF